MVKTQTPIFPSGFSGFSDSICIEIRICYLSTIFFVCSKCIFLGEPVFLHVRKQVNRHIVLFGKGCFFHFHI